MAFYQGGRRTKRALPKELIPSEDNECMTLVDYLTAKGFLFTHLAQETPTGSMKYGVWVKNHKALARNKAMGVNKGFPDYVVFVPEGKSKTGESKALIIEMKKEYGGSTSQEQKVWLENLGQVMGIETAVARGFDEAKQFIESHTKP